MPWPYVGSALSRLRGVRRKPKSNHRPNVSTSQVCVHLAEMDLEEL